jgi:hypothetical protein
VQRRGLSSGRRRISHFTGDPPPFAVPSDLPASAAVKSSHILGINRDNEPEGRARLAEDRSRGSRRWKPAGPLDHRHPPPGSSRRRRLVLVDSGARGPGENGGSSGADRCGRCPERRAQCLGLCNSETTGDGVFEGDRQGHGDLRRGREGRETRPDPRETGRFAAPRPAERGPGAARGGHQGRRGERGAPQGSRADARPPAAAGEGKGHLQSRARFRRS